MTDDEKHMINLWMHKCASYKFEKIHQVDASIDIRTQLHIIGKQKFGVNITNNDVMIAVQGISTVFVGSLSLCETDNSCTIIYRRYPCDIKTIHIRNLDLVLDSEESYFQQSLVQNIPLSYPEMLHFNDKMYEIRDIFFKQYNITEQKGIDTL